MTQIIIDLLATFTLVSNILMAVFFLTLIFRIKLPIKYKKILLKNNLWLVFLVSSTGFLGSLFLSEVAKLSPCILCWWQRIFMYPQPFLAATALYRREKSIVPYLLVLNIIGLLFSLYNYLIQVLPAAKLAACQIGCFVSCTANITYYFGYITFPLMAATGFLLNIIFLSYVKNPFRTK